MQRRRDEFDEYLAGNTEVSRTARSISGTPSKTSIKLAMCNE